MEQKRTKVFPNFSYLDVNPIQFGYEACQPSHGKPRNKANNFLLHVIIDGCGEYHNEATGERLELASGQGFLISPGDVSRYQADHNEPWTYYWLEFNGVKALSLMRQAGFTDSESTYQVLDSNQLQQITDIFERILEAESETLVIAHTYQLIHEIQASGQSEQVIIEEDAQHFLIKEAVKFIVRNYVKPIGVEDIADHCSLSRTYLTRLFKEEVGITPSKYLSQYRLSQAQELLKDPDYTIGEVAELTGFSNQFVFSTAFKKEFGAPPSAWRKEQT